VLPQVSKIARSSLL